MERREAIRENRWAVDHVRCMDCDALFELLPEAVSGDTNRSVGAVTRFMLVMTPETCPQCHSLKPMDDERLQVDWGEFYNHAAVRCEACHRPFRLFAAADPGWMRVTTPGGDRWWCLSCWEGRDG